jgi:CheY-like chemotaxis protein
MTTRQILLVDDNLIQATTRRIILEKTGSSIKMAASAQEALDFLADPLHIATTGLMITDHLMPNMNGPEMVRRLREQGLDLPVIVLSGLPDAETQYEGLNVMFRLKPFPPDSLIELVHEIFQDPLTRTA